MAVEVFWLNSRNLAHAVKDEGSEILNLYVLYIKFGSEGITQDKQVLVGSFPTSSASNFAFTAGHLVFSASITILMGTSRP